MLLQRVKMNTADTRAVIDGGRVTEIAARPMLNLHFPDLSVFSQPLAGEFAARRGLLERLAFPVGYGIEIGTLIDAWGTFALLTVLLSYPYVHAIFV